MNMLLDNSTLLEYYRLGGFVMLPLVATSVLLWYALAYRLLTVRGGGISPRDLVNKAQKQELKANSVNANAANFAVKQASSLADRKYLKSLISEKFGEIKLNLGQYRQLVRSLVAVAPLLGLLGTVDGMIETFDSLGDMALFAQSGGIAGGISKALFTTQMGLAVSIPGLLVGRMIERKERKIRRELDQIKDLACSSIPYRGGL